MDDDTADKPDDPPRGPQNFDPYQLLRDANYRRYLAAGMAATIGGQMQSVAVGWELYERTRSAAALGLVGLAQVLPVLLLAIPAGHAADRHSRKRQMVIAHLLLMAASLGLTALSAFQGPVGLTYLCLVLTGIGQAVNMPARWAILPQIVPRELLANAVTWNSSSWQIANVVGPALGGLVIALTRGATTAYVLDAVCCAGFIALVAPIRFRPVVRDATPITLGSLLAGLRFVLGTELILATITLDLFAVLLGGATALLPIFAKDVLSVGPTGLGWLRAAPSLGAFTMAIVLAHRPPMRRAGRSLLWAVLGFGLATIVFGFSTNPYLSFAMLFLTGAFDNVSVVVRATLVQVLTPDAMRGRVSAVNAIFIGSSNQLGEFESGMVARLFGAVASVVSGGVGTILVVLLVALVWPGVYRLGSLQDAANANGDADAADG
ncbi:MAG: MFS transporter [Isosphaeraceae bacterium]